MADNNIGKPLTMVEKVTEPNANTNVIINDNGNVHQVAVNDLLKNSDVNTSLNEVRKSTVANLININYQTTTINGVTCTNNGDGTYTLNGTASAETEFQIGLPKKLSKGTYKIVGCPIGGANDTYKLILAHNESPWYYVASDFGNGTIYVQNDDLAKRIIIIVAKGQTVNDLVFKPMITTDLDTTYDDFVQYIGDSGRLNKEVADLKNTFNTLTETIEGVSYLKIGRLVTVTGSTVYNGGNININCPRAIQSFAINVRNSDTGAMGIMYCDGVCIYDYLKTISIENGHTLIFSFSYISRE